MSDMLKMYRQEYHEWGSFCLVTVEGGSPKHANYKKGCRRCQLSQMCVSPVSQPDLFWNGVFLSFYFLTMFLFLVPFLPFRSLRLYTVCLFISSLCSVSSLSISGSLGISPDIPRYPRYRYPTRYQCNMSWFTMTCSYTKIPTNFEPPWLVSVSPP